MSFKEIKPEEIKDNPFKLIGKDWMLVTAGNKDKCNTMTASWGAVGIMWGKPSVTCYIRQSRYTKEFLDREDHFTISIFDEEYRKALSLCGSVSGRDKDKIKEAGLTVCEAGESVAFEEARLIIVCKKEYAQYMGHENFINKENDERWYGDKDYHTMYIGSIEKVLVKE